MPTPNLHPSLANTRAIITTRWEGTAYRPMTIKNIESYYVDTALDNDADVWTLDIGDPNGDYLEMLERDNEIRVQLFGVGSQGLDFLMTGIADEASWDDGTWTITGRDYSSLATDSILRPLQFKHVRPWAIVEEQAKFLGFKQTSLARGGMVKKAAYTDGSENYWEFWYRLYRTEKMWLWCEPNGMLVGSKLNYDQPATYYLGSPRSTDAASVKMQHIPVIKSALRKTTQGRVWEVMVYGHKGDTGFNTTAYDNTISGWIKRPRKVMLDTESHTIKGAQKLAWEEIFEGKVGSVEFKITIPDPGFTLRQNRIARLNLPDIGLFGNFFIVGSRIQAGSDGFVQEIRLREKNYAVSRRVPAEPKKITSKKSGDVMSVLGASVEQSANIPTGWGDYFVKAAKEFSGIVDYNLFLATLLAISDRETGGTFLNERENGGPGGDHHAWYPYQEQGSGSFPPPGKQLPGTIPSPGAPGGKTIPTGETRAQYEQKFANEKGGRYGLTKEYGVGPMQLTSRGLKNLADDRLKPNYRDEYEGGRWHPEHNIWIGARNLAECVKEMGFTRDIDMWYAADAYNLGIAGAKAYFAQHSALSPYGQAIKVKVLVDPKYLDIVNSAVQAAQEAANAARDGDTSFIGDSGTPLYKATENQCLKFFNSYNPSTAGPQARRDAIVLAAMYAWYKRSEIHYIPPGGIRDSVKTIGQPPSIPRGTDCSGFVTWLYFLSGAVDPNGRNYAGNGFTGDLWNTGQHISVVQLKPGDLVFYGNPAAVNSHVAVYIGNNQVISHGTESDPSVQPIKMMSNMSGFATYSL